MLNWIQHPVILEGAKVKLVPLDGTHFDELVAISKEEKIWEFMSVNMAQDDKLLLHLKSAVLKRGTGEQYPFTVIDQQTGKVIGSTLFHSMYPEHRKLEIGWTWYGTEYWRKGYNRECKLLLLTYCFEQINTIRVQLVTDENNHRSRTAIMGIGGVFEGVLRNERIRSSGVYRNTAIYSIVEDEWPDAKAKLILSTSQ
jgi:RimJ/RimL family protein N-acetyltransferase